jgi:hypothetical protein
MRAALGAADGLEVAATAGNLLPSRNSIRSQTHDAPLSNTTLPADSARQAARIALTCGALASVLLLALYFRLHA